MLYPLTIYDIFNHFAQHYPEQATKLESNRNELLLFLGMMQIALLGIVFVVTIFISHKIAGPMYKLKTYLTGLTNGESVTPLYFRKGDYFLDVAQVVNDYVQANESKRREDFKYLEEVSLYINNLALVVPEDKKPVLLEILSKLSEIQQKSTN